MAAPTSKTINDLNGRWAMNKTLSDRLEPALALQGVSWIARVAVGLVSVNLEAKQFKGPPFEPSKSSESATIIDVAESVTGVLGSDHLMQTSCIQYCVDLVWREKKDPIFGAVRFRCSWCSPDEIGDEFLGGNWLRGDEEATGPDGKTHLLFQFESVKNGWVGQQVWGFQTISDERRHVRNLVVRKGGDRVECRVVYDYLS